MAVIDTNMDMPSSCTVCDYSTCEDFMTHGYCSKLDDYFVQDDFKNIRLEKCPFKSIDGLIEAINNHNTMSFYTKQDAIADVMKYCGGNADEHRTDHR